MTKPIAIYTGGIFGLKQIAVANDGKVYKRFQEKTFRGCVWTAWKYHTTVDVNALPVEMIGCHRAMPNGSSVNDAALFDRKGNIRVRLP